jgi:hypothetical protein
MELREWKARLEELEVYLSKEYYKQYAGFPYDEEVMEEHSSKVQELCRVGLEQFSRDTVPDPLFVYAVRGTEEASQTRLRNEIYRKRNQDVSITLDDQEVNLNSVRVFNRVHVSEPEIRKKVFDELMEKAGRLTETLWNRFQVTEEAYRRHDLDPLEVYVLQEDISLEKLKQVVDESATRAKEEFQSESEELSHQVVGKEMEYYDDLYVFRHKIFDAFDPLFADVDI